MFSLQTEILLLCFPHSPTSGISESRTAEWQEDIVLHTMKGSLRQDKGFMLKTNIEMPKVVPARRYGRQNRKQEFMLFSKRRSGERNKYFKLHYVLETVLSSLSIFSSLILQKLEGRYYIL